MPEQTKAEPPWRKAVIAEGNAWEFGTLSSQNLAKTTLVAALAADAEVQVERNALRDFALSFAQCPCCCSKSETCHPDCTFEEDCKRVNDTESYDRMVRAREALAVRLPAAERKA